MLKIKITSIFQNNLGKKLEKCFFLHHLTYNFIIYIYIITNRDTDNEDLLGKYIIIDI